MSFNRAEKRRKQREEQNVNSYWNKLKNNVLKITYSDYIALKLYERKLRSKFKNKKESVNN